MPLNAAESVPIYVNVQLECEFHMAVVKNDWSTVSRLIQSSSVDVDCPFSPFGQTALALAIWHDARDVFQTVVNLGCAINVQDVNGVSPLMVACQSNDALFYVHHLMKHRCNVHLKHKASHETALHVAVRRRDLSLISTLIKYGADLECRCRQGGTVLIHALQNQWAEGVINLVKWGANCNARDAAGFSCVFHAAYIFSDICVRHKILKLMIDTNLDLDCEWWIMLNDQLITPIPYQTMKYLIEIKNENRPKTLTKLCRNEVRRLVGPVNADKTADQMYQSKIIPLSLKECLNMEV